MTQSGSAYNSSSPRPPRASLAATALALLLVAAAPGRAAEPFTPNFFDPAAHLEKPDLGASQNLRFIADDDYPPFHYAAPGGGLTGFDVDLARAVCGTLKLSCTIQARRYDTLRDTLEKGEADVILGSIRIDAKARETLDFSAPYARAPARFARLRNSPLVEATPETLRGRLIGVIGASAHEAYLEDFFKGATRKAYPSLEALTAALKAGEVDVVFADGIALSFWLQGPAAAECCAFSGGPYLESRYFGEGIGFALRKGDPALRRALDYALAQLFARGTAADLYLKYFPVGVY